MATWKKVLLSGDETNTNIGSSNLTVANSVDRRLIFGGTASTFGVRNSANNLVLKLAHTTATLGSTVNTATLTLNSSTSTLTMSHNVATFAKTSRLSIESDSNAAGAVPVLDLYRNEATIEVDDMVGAVAFNSDDDGGNKTTYAKIEGQAVGIGDGAEDGKIYMKVRSGGSLKDAIVADGISLDVSAELKENDFIISSDSTGNVEGPNLILRKTDTGPASGESGAKIIFQAEGADNAMHDYASISTIHQDVVSGNEDGQLSLNVLRNDTEQTAFSIKGNDLKLYSEMSGSTFLIRSTEQTDTADAPQLNLYKFDTTPADDGLIGRIRFSGATDDGDDTVSSADYGSIHVSTSEVDTGSEDGEMHFNVMKAGSSTNVLTIGHDGGAAASNSNTANEEKLKGLEVHGTSLEALSRRSLIQFDFSENSIKSTSNTTSFYPDLERSAVEPVHVVDDYDTSFGFLAPYNCFLTGATFAYKRNSSVSITGHAQLEAIIVHADGSADTEVVISTNHEHNNNYSRSSVFHFAAGSQRSIQLAAGDKVLPKVTINKGAGQGNYAIMDVLGSFYLYTESSGL